MSKELAVNCAVGTQKSASHQPKISQKLQENPTQIADRIGQAYATGCDNEHRKNFGLFLTPPAVARFMAGMLKPHKTMRLLDPAAGAGILLCAAVERLVTLPSPPRSIEITAYEIDANLAEHLSYVLNYLSAWSEQFGVHVTVTLRRQDFIMAEAVALRGLAGERFDAVIANPPYFKIGKGDSRAIAASSVVHGQPNIYGLFMAVSAAMLRQDGELIFITPRSFASGPYFKRFRERFFTMMRPVKIHVFESRRDAFSRDAVLQENVILNAIRDDGWSSENAEQDFTISSSVGMRDLDLSCERTAPLNSAIDLDDLSGPFRLPTSSKDDDILRRMDGWTGSLHAYGLDISTGPVVPFRATEFLTDEGNGVTVPLLWMNHVQAMSVCWPIKARKPQHITNQESSRRLLVRNRNYVLLRRFSAKEEHRRLTAAPMLADNFNVDRIGLENHLNYIHRPGGTLSEDEAYGLAALYNSALFDGYFRCISGNTQVSATELRAMPLPPLEIIALLGRRVRAGNTGLESIDELVDGLVATVEASRERHIQRGERRA